LTLELSNLTQEPARCPSNFAPSLSLFFCRSPPCSLPNPFRRPRQPPQRPRGTRVISTPRVLPTSRASYQLHPTLAPKRANLSSEPLPIKDLRSRSNIAGHRWSCRARARTPRGASSAPTRLPTQPSQARSWPPRHQLHCVRFVAHTCRPYVTSATAVIQEKSNLGFAARTSKADLQGEATTKVVLSCQASGTGVMCG